MLEVKKGKSRDVSGRDQNVDKQLLLSLCLSVMGVSVTGELGLDLCSQGGSGSTLRPVVQGGIALSI